MKISSVLLAGSLATNVVLVAILLSRSSAEVSSTRLAFPMSTDHAGVPAPPPVTAEQMAIKTVAHGEPNFHSLVAQLRAAGYSERVVRRAAGIVVAHYFNDRGRELGVLPARDPIEFWKSPVVMTGSGTPEQIAGRRALEREQHELMRSLFGADYDVSEDDRRRRAHGLPEQTAQMLHRIFADYRDLEEKARADASGSSDIRGKLDLLAKEKRADIERLLTPEQLLEFDLRMGAGAGVHNRLGAFEATEAEFRALYLASKSIDEANPSIPARERMARFEPELRRVLGESRYSELLAANEKRDQQSRAFVEMRSFVMGLNLAPSVASDVLTIQAQFQPQLNLVARNPSLNAEQKATARAAIGNAARKELLRVLGPAAFDAYERSKSGWLATDRESPAKSRQAP